MSNTEQEQRNQLIKRRHPSYERLKGEWDFFEHTYDGGRDWFEKNIHRYIKEGDEEFRGRLKRAYRFNHTREIIDLINKYLFKQRISRNENDATDAVKKFWEKTTNTNLSIKDFMRQVSRLTSLYGRIAIVVDSTYTLPQNEEGEKRVISRKEQDEMLNDKTKGIYAYVVPPQLFLDCGYDKSGELNWVLIAEAVRDDDDPMTSSGNIKYNYRLWTKNDWKLFANLGTEESPRVEEIDSGDTFLGHVPIIIAENMITDNQYETPSLVNEISHLDRAVANYLSNLDAIIQDQTFSQLVVPAQSMLNGEAEQKLREMGTNRIFSYDASNATTAPQFISPDVKQAQLIIDAINKIINEMYHTVGMAGERTKQDNSLGIDNSSGVAKAYDFERVNALLASKADSLELVEHKLVRLVMLWSGEDDGKLPNDNQRLVDYPDNFDSRGLYDEFDIAARLMLIEAPDEVRRKQMEAVITKLFPQVGEEQLKKLLDSLKDYPIDPIELANRLTDKDGQGNLATTSTASTQTGGNAKTTNKESRQGQVTKDTK